MAATPNRFANSPTAPATGAVAVATNDGTDLASVTRALYIGGAGSGNLKVTMANGDVIALAGVAAGTVLPLSVARVWQTGTDVTGIVALY